MSSILEQQLVALADRIDVDVGEQFVDGILARLDVDPQASFRPAAPRRARTLVAFLAAAALAIVFILPSPRRTVAHWFGIGSVRIEAPAITSPATTTSTPATSTPPTSGSATTTPATSTPPTSGSATTTPVTFPATLDLGDPTTAADATSRTGLPTALAPTLGAPTGIYVVTPPESGQIVVIYPPSDVLPSSPVAGVGALLSTLPGSVGESTFVKVRAPGTTVDTFSFTSSTGAVIDAIWLAGEPHDFFFVGRDGELVWDTMRLATNTLLWTVGDVTYRLEAEISSDTAMSIARSVGP